MNINELIVKGKFNADGVISFYGLNEFKNFAKQNKNLSFVASFHIIDKEKGIINYYKKMLLPQIQNSFFEKGDRLSKTEIDLRLRNISNVAKNEETGELKNIYSLNKAEQKEFLEDIKQYLAENLEIFVYD